MDDDGRDNGAGDDTLPTQSQLGSRLEEDLAAIQRKLRGFRISAQYWFHPPQPLNWTCSAVRCDGRGIRI